MATFRFDRGTRRTWHAVAARGGAVPRVALRGASDAVPLCEYEGIPGGHSMPLRQIGNQAIAIAEAEAAEDAT
jgi:hypothetical protein